MSIDDAADAFKAASGRRGGQLDFSDFRACFQAIRRAINQRVAASPLENCFVLGVASMSRLSRLGAEEHCFTVKWIGLLLLSRCSAGGRVPEGDTRVRKECASGGAAKGESDRALVHD